MKVFVEYLDYDLAGKLRNPCGDRSIVQLDGRNSLGTWILDAHKNNGHRRPQYPHFRIMKGDLRSAVEIYATCEHDEIVNGY